MQKTELYSIKYADRHSAALIFRQLINNQESLGLTSVGLEKFKSKSNRTSYKIIIAISTETSDRIPAILSSVKESLKDHPLFPHLSFDNYVTPICKVDWDFGSYEDENYQRVFIRKRQD